MEAQPVAPTFEELVEYCQIELSTLWVYWKDYQQLFAGPESRVNLMKAVAPVFFATHHRLLQDAILLGIARLTDPLPKNKDASKECASIHLLFRMLPDELRHQEIYQEKLDEAKDRSEPIRQVRSKRIAHRDRMTWAGELQLPALDHSQVQGAIVAIGDFLNSVETGLGQTPSTYSLTIQAFGGAQSVLVALQRAIAFRRLKDEAPELDAKDLCPDFADAV